MAKLSKEYKDLKQSIYKRKDKKVIDEILKLSLTEEDLRSEEKVKEIVEKLKEILKEYEAYYKYDLEEADYDIFVERRERFSKTVNKNRCRVFIFLCLRKS